MKNRLKAEFDAIKMDGKQTEEDKLLADTVGFKTISEFRNNLEDLIEKASTLSTAFKLLKMTYPAVKWQSVRFCLENALKCLEDESDTEQEVIENE